MSQIGGKLESRKAFEKWILKTRKQTQPWGLTELNHAGDGYLDLYTQKQWEGWQAGFAAGEAAEHKSEYETGR